MLSGHPFNWDHLTQHGADRPGEPTAFMDNADDQLDHELLVEARGTVRAPSPVSRWVLRKISNIPKFLILIGPWGPKGCEFTWYRGFFTRSPPHIARISKKTGLFSVIPIKHSTGHSGRNFHSIQKVFFSKCSSWCKLSKTDHVYYKIVL